MAHERTFWDETYETDLQRFQHYDIRIIAAIGQNHEMGNEGSLLCSIPHDLQRFKEITMGHTVMMGRKTWESLPTRPLPHRRNIVLTHSDLIDNRCERYASIHEALQSLSPTEAIFIIGGATLYRQFLSLAHTLYLTRIEERFIADTFFPEMDWNAWQQIEEIRLSPDRATPYPLRFQVWKKR